MEIALCATVEERKGGFNRTIVKNKIIKYSVKETWEDVIEYVIGNRDISDVLDAALDQGKYEVCLQTNTGPETFQASPDDFVGTAFEFEKNIKYVDFIITLNERKNTKNNDTCVPTESNAFDVLMEESRSFKQPPKKETDSLRFTGNCIKLK